MNISHMNLDELQDLQKQVATAIVQHQKQARKEIKKQIRALAEQHGTTIEELFGAKLKGTRPASSTTPTKYRNPDNSGQVWSGRGRMPHWLHERLQRGAEKTDFLIK